MISHIKLSSNQPIQGMILPSILFTGQPLYTIFIHSIFKFLNSNIPMRKSRSIELLHKFATLSEYYTTIIVVVYLNSSILVSELR